ncbi:hypothetical protein ABZY44_14270 [Streptomyces sp. NPDC006544]|uniref:hypothetical protein n=1 Tax=Streptomyces sp. NPDC006544 TaxID=3154583 RepID=UPI0033A41460
MKRLQRGAHVRQEAAFMLGWVRGALNAEQVRRSAGLLLALVCMSVGVWAVITFVTGDLATSDKLGVFSLLIALLPAAGLAAKLLKPSADVDLVKAAGSLAEAVEASELAQRTRLLAGDNQPIDVGFTFRSAPSRAATGAGPTGRLSEIGEYYRRLQPGRLLITGGAGAAKTILATELMPSSGCFWSTTPRLGTHPDPRPDGVGSGRGGGGQPAVRVVHFWLESPWQSHSWSCVPSVVE